MNQEDLVKRYKLKMKDLEYGNVPITYDTVQLKFDGWWTCVIVQERSASTITSGGEERFTFIDLEAKNAVLLCEWIYGTNWAQGNHRSGKYMVFDILFYDTEDISNLPYEERYEIARQWINESSTEVFNKFELVRNWDRQDWKEVWKEQVEGKGFEGLIFRNSQDPFFASRVARMKRAFSMDYIVMGFKEGTGRLEGTLGAIEGGLILNGKVEKICSVGSGFCDSLRDEIWNHKADYLGTVFEATGKSIFSTGSLRHPAFSRFRPDKNPSQCIFYPLSEVVR